MLDLIIKVCKKLGFISDVLTVEQIEQEILKIHQRRAKMVVMRFSRGNVLLAQGKYVTRKQLDEALGLQGLPHV